MAKTDWQMGDTVKPDDLNQIGQEINENADAITDHVAATTGVHGATSAATPNTLVQRDGNGRIKAAAPSASDDVARKAEVDGKVSKSGDTMTGLLLARGGIDLEVPSVPVAKKGTIYANGANGLMYYHDLYEWHEVWYGGNNPASLASAGYQRLASGLILQWGSVVVTSGESYTVYFPIVFPNLVASVYASLDSSDVASVTTSGLGNNRVNLKHNAPGQKHVFYLAIGW